MNILERTGLGLLRMSTKFSQATRKMWKDDDPRYFEPSLYNVTKEGYGKNELVFRCVNERAQAAASASIHVFNDAGAPQLNHPLAKLFHKPNPYMSEFDLWEITTIYHDLAGRAYWEQVRGPLGNTVELWPLRPDRVKAVGGANDLIAYYEYHVPGTEPFKLDAENVIEIKTFDPLNLYGSVAPALVAARGVSVDNAVTDFLKLFFERGGVPQGLIKTKKKLVDTDVTDIRRRWRQRYGGYQNWVDPAVLDMDAEYQKTGLTFAEMGFEVLDARNEIKICQALSVPPILVGARVGLERATYANYREARTAFWEDIIIPLFKHYRDTFQRELADEEWVGLTLNWDFTKVPVLFEKLLEQRQQFRADFLAGGLLLDEYRKEMGYGPLPAKSGQVRVQSLAYQIIPNGEKGQLVPMKNPVGAGDTKFNKMEFRSPACRQKGESEDDCVSRKVPEIMRENPGMDNKQAVAIAYSMCKKPCKKDAVPDKDERIRLEQEAVINSTDTLNARKEALLEVLNAN